MVYLANEVFISLIIIFIEIIFEIFFIYRISKALVRQRYPKTLIFLLLIFTFLLFRDFAIFFSIFAPQNDRGLFIGFSKVYLLSTLFITYIFFLFSEKFEYDSILTRDQFLVTIVATVISTLIVISNLIPIWSDQLNMYRIATDYTLEMLMLTLNGIMGMVVTISFWNGYKDVWITQERQLKLLIIGNLIIFFIPWIFTIILLFYSIPPNIFIRTLIRAFNLIGLLFYYFSFHGFNYPSLFKRQRADKIMVTDLNGIPLFTYDFKEDIHKIDAILFAGAIVAITQLMLESIKSPSPIIEVAMKNQYKIMLEYNSNFLTLILTPKGDSYLRSSLDNFSYSFDKNFSSIIASGEVHDISLFEKGARSILTTRFGIPWQFLPESES